MKQVIDQELISPEVKKIESKKVGALFTILRLFILFLGFFFILSAPIILASNSSFVYSFFSDSSEMREVVSFLFYESENISFFNDSELSHMYDVRRLISYGSFFFVFSLVVLFFYFFKYTDKRLLFLIGKFGLFFMVFLLIFSLANFGLLFTLFHLLFFPMGNWSFPSDSTIISLFPQEVFFVVAVFCLSISFFVYLFCYYQGRS